MTTVDLRNAKIGDRVKLRDGQEGTIVFIDEYQVYSVFISLGSEVFSMSVTFKGKRHLSGDDHPSDVIEHFPHKSVVEPSKDAGVKYDNGKIRMDLIPPTALEEIAKVLTFGATKYGDWNWSNGLQLSRVAAACERHLLAWKKGEDLDPESGLHHAAHAAVNAMFLVYFYQHRKDLDDRHVPQNKNVDK